jgi:hypothetical protein
VRFLEGLRKHAIAALAILAGTQVARVFEVHGVDRARRETNESMTSADEDACSSAFSSSGSKGTCSSSAISYPFTVSSRGTMPWRGTPNASGSESRTARGAGGRQCLARVTVKSWTGMVARPRETSRFSNARGMGGVAIEGW